MSVPQFFLTFGFALGLIYVGIVGLVRVTLRKSAVDPRFWTALLIAGIGFAVMAFVALWMSS